MSSFFGRRRLFVGAFIVAVTSLGLTGAASSGAAAGKPTLTVAGPYGCGNVSPANGGLNPVESVAYTPLINEDVNYNFTPGLATSWKLSPYKGRNNKAITLTLRRGVRFADGTAFNAQALKTWIDYRATKSTQYSAQLVKPVVQVLGKYKVRIIVETPNPDLPWALGPYADWGTVASPKAVAASLADPSHDWLATHTDGAGPYTYAASQSVTGDHCTFLPNKYYYDQSQIKWGKIVEKIITDDNTALATLKTGQVDVAVGYGQDIASAVSSAGLGLSTTTSGSVLGLLIRDEAGVTVKPLGSVLVRRALNYAVNRKVMATGLAGGRGIVTSNEDDSRVLPPKWQNYYNYDPAKAKNLLAAAGYPNGFNLQIFTRGPAFGGALDNSAGANALAQYFDAVGVKTTVVPVNTLSPLLSDFADKSAPWGGVWITIATPSTAAMYVGLQAKGAFLNDPHGWHDPVVDKLYYKAIVAPTAKAASAVWDQLDERLIAQAYYVPVYQVPAFTYFSKRVGGVVGGRYAFNSSFTTTWYPTGK